MELQQRIAAFVQLGKALRALSEAPEWPGFSSGLTGEEFLQARATMESVRHHNGWFTPEEVRRAFSAWADLLTESRLSEWLRAYADGISRARPQRVALICAGNIPMVGFHDILCSLIAGHEAQIKLSSDDAVLIPMLLRILERIEPEWTGKIHLVEKVGGFDRVIATGSTNTARYFHRYFGSFPHLIRRGRTSAAILSGRETPEQMLALGHDIFDYFGLGCRSVSKLYVPEDYDLDVFFQAIFPFQEIIRHHKYANNYDYNKAVWLLNKETLLDNGFLLLKEDRALASPTASLFYERYSDPSQLEGHLDTLREQLQCIVGNRHVPFGETQHPELSDYADGADTMQFLLAG